jgi:catechol 2,3-dioxygenase-like lactoylglutathione lyase family enzyme
MTPETAIIPELSVRDPQAAQLWLCGVLGFVVAGDEVRLGSQRIALTRGAPGGHGRIDHLALAVADVDLALAPLLAAGVRLDDTTPDGPLEIAEFWGSGVRYAFVQGPEGARIELCARRSGDTRSDRPDQTLPGHDHIGIPCTDITATEGFFLSLGLQPVAAVDLIRPEGHIPVRFLGLGSSVVELYAPRVPPACAAQGLWAGLRLTGTTLTKGPRVGPDGLRLSVV